MRKQLSRRRHFHAGGDGVLCCAEFVAYYKAAGIWAEKGYSDETFEEEVWPASCSKWGGEPATGIPLRAWTKCWKELGSEELEKRFGKEYKTCVWYVFSSLQGSITIL